MENDSTVNFAVLGGGKIMPRIVKGIKLAPHAHLYAMGSRDAAKARANAKDQGADTYGTYDQLLDDPRVQAVYVATYNPGHYDLIAKALAKGKNVISEKPMVPTAQQVDELFDMAAAHKVLLMEADKGVFLPLNVRIREMIAQGVFGDIIFAKASYSYNGQFADSHWVYDRATGGSMLDVGVYPVSVLNYLIGQPIAQCQRQLVDHGGVDGFSLMTIRYANGVLAEAHSGTIVNTDNVLGIYGTEGYLLCEHFWKSGHADYWLADGRHELNEPMVSDFTYEVEHFADCVIKGLTESPVMSRAAQQQIIKVVGK